MSDSTISELATGGLELAELGLEPSPPTSVSYRHTPDCEILQQRVTAQANALIEKIRAFADNPAKGSIEQHSTELHSGVTKLVVAAVDYNSVKKERSGKDEKSETGEGVKKAVSAHSSSRHGNNSYRPDDAVQAQRLDDRAAAASVSPIIKEQPVKDNTIDTIATDQDILQAATTAGSLFAIDQAATVDDRIIESATANQEGSIDLRNSGNHSSGLSKPKPVPVYALRSLDTPGRLSFEPSPDLDKLPTTVLEQPKPVTVNAELWEYYWDLTAKDFDYLVRSASEEMDRHLKDFFAIVQRNNTPETKQWDIEFRYEITKKYFKLRQAALDKFNHLALRHERWRQELQKEAAESGSGADTEMLEGQSQTKHGESSHKACAAEQAKKTQPKVSCETAVETEEDDWEAAVAALETRIARKNSEIDGLLEDFSAMVQRNETPETADWEVSFRNGLNLKFMNIRTAAIDKLCLIVDRYWVWYEAIRREEEEERERCEQERARKRDEKIRKRQEKICQLEET